MRTCAGIQNVLKKPDSGLRRNDARLECSSFQKDDYKLVYCGKEWYWKVWCATKFP
jgi:hypothetical protein